VRSAEYEVLHNGDLIEMEVRFCMKVYIIQDIIRKIACQRKNCSETQYVEIGEWGGKCRFLASLASLVISIQTTYIVFLTEMQKRQTLQNGFASIKNDITTIFYGHDTCVL